MRRIVYEALTGWAPLDPLVGQRIYEASSVDVHTPKPFVVVRMHTGFPIRPVIGGRHYAQVWAHDNPGSYLRIDEILVECRRAIEAHPPDGDFLEARWIETGVDLRDDGFETVTRYCRFQLTHTLRELHA